MVVCFVVVVGGNFVKKIEALIELKNVLIMKTLLDVRFGNCSTPN